MADVHVVPSGKVYRQIFDAEVQLVRSLDEVRKKHIPCQVPLDSGKIAMARAPDTAGEAVQRQGVWTQGMTNSSSGKRVCRGEFSSSNRHYEESEDQIAAEEVRGLSDVIVAEKTGSDIIERLTENKQQRHAEAVSQLHQELVVVSADFEPLFREAGEDLLHRLSESDKEMEELLQRIDSDNDLEKFTFQGLHEYWGSVSQESLQRRKWIEDLDETLNKYESERAVMIEEILKKYTQMLEKISYLMPPDIHRFMDKESMMINQALLANRRATGRLFVNLMEHDLQRELSHRLRWEDKLQDWKKIKMQDAIDRFKEFMSSPHIQSPEAVQRTLDTMRKAQESLCGRRLNVLQSLSSITPPRCTKSVVSEWYSSLSTINEQIDTLHIDTMTKLRSYYEQIWQDCLAEIERFKKEVSSYALSDHEVHCICNNKLLPLVGQSQRNQEAYLEAMDKSFEELAKRVSAQSKVLFKFARGAAHLWELHSTGLQRKEQLLQDQLDEIRHAHDQDNQGKEASLDIMMDKLRQESTEEALKNSLDKALSFLEEIKNGYFTFYKEQVDVVESYPAMVLEELQLYSTAVSKFFHVKEIFKQETEEQYSVCSTSLSLDAGGKGFVRKKRHPTTGQGRKRLITSTPKGASNPQSDHMDLLLTCSSVELQSTEDELESQIDSHDPSQICETFTTSRGNVYNAWKSILKVSEDGEQSKPPSYVEVVLLSDSMLTDLLKSVRLAFFEHLEDRYQITLTNATSIVAAKKDELKSELELRLHLHQPRAKRIEMDIHNVRAAELVLHRDRVERHCKGITEALNTLKAEFVTLRQEQKTLTEDFRRQIYGMESIFINASKSDILVGLCGSLQSNLDKHMGLIQTSLRQYRQKLESTLGRLRESNAEFIKSFRLFSEGGNFTPEEIDLFQRRLEKTSGRIDSTDELLLLDMEGMESKCLEQATEVVNKFEDKFHYLTVDLTFMEKIQRLLTNTQVLIKTEVTKSNRQTENLSTYLAQFESKIDACARPNIDKETVTPDDLYSFTRFIMEELKKRCLYLDCLIDITSTDIGPEAPLQGSFATAARTETLKQEKLGSQTTDSLLQPSRMGRPAIEDVAVGVIQHILQTQKSKVMPDLQGEQVERSQPLTAGTYCAGQTQSRPTSEVAVALRRSVGSATGLRTEAPLRRVSSTCVKRFSKPTRFDKRFQVFGPKPEQEPVSFKEVINSILWKANDVLLAVAEEFYKKKERRAITRPQYLQETFEHCAEVLNSKLLSYQNQAHDYHNACLQEFREQLMRFEQCLSHVPRQLIGHLSEQHLQKLSQATSQIYHHFALKQQESEHQQNDHWNKLRPTLGHPNSVNELESLCNLEEVRLKELINTIDTTKLQLQECLKKHAEDFVTALASLTENLLLLLDDFVTIDDIQIGQIAVVKEKTCTLIRRKQAGLPLEDKQYKPLIQRGSRTWPGIPYFEPKAKINAEKSCRETASVKTGKTTLGHLSAVEARDSVYQKHQTEYDKEITRTEEEWEAQRKSARQWEESWKESVLKIKQLYV
ncbi:coiled-coil domain-containing protein 180 isoform X1 [Lepisosteus oculatus]|uniref:coiled-coil domain-containing protein 180 isoform X1 n=2 Tax=Lepisosteus oculatus TaxID=7918 RepID=UPI0037171DA6